MNIQLHHFQQQCTRDSLILSCADIFWFPEERADSFTWCEGVVFVVEPDSARLLKKLRSAYYRAHSFYVIFTNTRESTGEGESRNDSCKSLNRILSSGQCPPSLKYIHIQTPNRVRAPGFLKSQS